MSGLRRQLVAALALLVVVFGQLTPANATPMFPSVTGETTKQLIQIDRNRIAQVQDFFATLGIEPTHTYADVFAGFAVELTADQKTYLQYLLPGIVIQPDQPIEATETQDDATWGLSSLDSLGLNYDSSYSYPTSAGFGVKVYVLDTGIRPNAEQFGSRLLSGFDALGQGVTSDCGSGHGTHVAGTIASKAFGVAKRASLVPVRVLNCSGEGMTSDLIRGIDWVVRDNPAGSKAVMNLSLGADRTDFFLNLAVNNAKNDGVFPVVAAGNDARDACNYSPANAPAAFTIGAVDSSNRLTNFSNKGSCISLLAPGSNILSLSTGDSGSNPLKSGTSMAAPHVAGVAALYLAENPGATMNGLRDALLNNADASAVNAAGTTSKIVKAKFLLPVQQNESSSSSNSDEGELIVESAEEPTPPANSSAPAITGQPFVSQVLTAEDGTWTGTPTPTLSYQWYACSAVVLVAVSTKPTSCTAISRAIGKTFTLSSTQRAKFVTVAVKAAVGSDSVSSFAPSTAFAVTTAPTVKLTATGSAGTVRFTQTSTASLNTKFTVSVTGFSSSATYAYKWFRCETAQTLSTASPEEGCAEIAGATKNAYVVTATDLGSYITPFIRATKGPAVLSSARIASSKDVLQAPVAVGDPSAPGEVISVGQSINALNGTWLGDPTFRYQWYSCSKPVPAANTKNKFCTAIKGATQKIFTIPANQNNKYLVVQVLASNITNQTAPVSRYSSTSTKVLNETSVIGQPSIAYSGIATTGQPIVGSAISARAAKWAGNPAPTISRQWYLCDSDFSGGVVSELPSDCSEIEGATGASVTAILAWQDKFVTFAEVGTNTVSSVTVAAAVSHSVQTKPLFSEDPTLSGNASTNSMLTVSPSASAVGGSPSVSYQWFKCLTSQPVLEIQPAGCSPIAGATSSTFTLNRAQEGAYVNAKVTLTNAAGVAVRFTETTEVVTGDSENLTIAKPSISSGHARIGEPVRAGASTWSGYPEPTLTYQWLQCDDVQTEKSFSQPAGCREVDGVSTSYSPVLADSGKYMVVRVTATQESVATSVFSPSSGQVWEAPNFTLLNPPGIGSNSAKGEVLAASANGARGVPELSKAYQWYRCETYVASDAANLEPGCVAIRGEVAETYTFAAADVGKYVLVAVSITNPLGTSKRFTRSSTIVNSQPENLSIRIPSAGAAVLKTGTTLTADNGTWSALPDPTFTYQWVRCQISAPNKSASIPGSCSNINGSTSATYQLSTADSGKFVSVAVTATNGFGYSTVYSPTTAAVGEPVSFEADPMLSTFNKKDEIATHQTLQIRGFPEPTRIYRWLRCPEVVSAPSSVAPANCVAIPKATQASYAVVNDDVTKYLVLEVTIKNTHNSQTQYTQSSEQILKAPEISGALVISGNQWVGRTLTAVGFSVAGFPEPTVSYQWYRNRSVIPGATSATYTLQDGDAVNLISYQVTSENRAGVILKDSVSSGLIGQPPTLLGTNPTVGGVESDGEVSAGETVRLEGYSVIAFPEAKETYQWYSCATRYTAVTIGSIPSNCVAISKATKDELLVSFTHEGRYIGYSLVAKNNTDDKIWFSETTARVYVKPKYVSGAKTSFATGEAAKDGSPRVGYTIEATNGTWRGSATAEYSYSWFTCSKTVPQSLLSRNALCEEIYREDGTASNRVLTITPDLIGKYIGVHIVGKYKYNSVTDDSAFSNLDEVFTLSTSKPVIEPPVNVTPPRIASRYPYVGATLKATKGTWRGTPNPTQSHLWWVCDSQILVATTVQPEGCVVVPKSNGNLTLAASHLGKYISMAETAVNSADSTTMWSVSNSEPVSTGPVNVTAPQISVTAPATLPSTLSVLSVSNGTWYSYQEPDWDGYAPPQLSSYNWFRCETQVTQASENRDNSCSIIEGAFQQSYTPVRADAGKFVMASVRFSNRDRQGVSHEWIAYSTSTTVVNLPPANLEVPTITGAPFVDRAVPSTPGTWEGQPNPTFTYQWFACDEASDEGVTGAAAPGNCASITSATAERFTPKIAQLDKYLLLKVTGTNSVGSAIAWSTYSPAVVSGPVLKTAPTYTYPNALGHPLVSSTQATQTDGGIWQGTPEPAKAYEWLACNTPVTNGSETEDASETAECEVIEGANASTINPPAAARGKFLMVHVTAENIHGVAHWYSATTSAVWMAPVLDTPVSVFGTMFHELRAKAKFDTWIAFPEPSKTYQWFVCSSVTLTPAVDAPNDCSPISGATSSIFTIPELAEDALQEEFAQKHLIVRVTANNEVNVPAVSHSATSASIKPGPVNKVSPVISGQTVFALQTVTTLSADDGTWKPSVAADTEGSTETSRQWYRCANVQPAFDELDPSCEAIGGETGPTYNLRADDPGKAILVAVTGRVGELESVTYSASTPLISERVNNVATPFVLDPPIAGTAVGGDKGEWRGFPTPVVKTQAWYSCKTKVEAFSVSTATKPKAPTGCTVLPKTNLPTFKIPDPPKKADPKSLIGKFLVYAVTQENVVAGVKTTVTVFSPSTEKIAILPRLDPDRPELIRPADEGDDEDPSVGTIWTIKANWTAGDPTKTYQWYTCAALVSSAPDTFTLPDGCTAVEGATNTSYTIRLADSGRFLMASATGVNTAGSVTAFSFSSDRPVGRAPQATTMPVLSGGRNDGDLLSVTDGIWDMDTEPTTFKWYACSTPVTETTTSVPSTCEDISETGSTYQQSAAFDGGKYITVLVSAKAPHPARATTSYLLAVTEGTRVTPSIAIGNRLPRLTYDTYLVGDEFAIQSGQWEGLPAPELTYSWFRCKTPVESPSATLPAGCTPISDATSISYRAVDADAGSFIMGAETGTNNAGTGPNSLGSRTYYTETSDDPIERSFVMDSLVSVTASGLEIDRDESVTITRTNGTWSGGTGSPVFVHRWVYCDKPVSTGAQLFPAGCNWMFDTTSGGRLDPRDTQTTLNLDMATPFAGYYIASAEYLQKPLSPTGVENPANRVTYRLSATTGKIKIAPALWTIDVTDELVATTGNGGFKPPTVPTQAIVGESVALTQIEQNSNGWYPTTDPLTMPPGKQVTWRGVEGGNFTYQWFQCETRISALSSSQPSGCSAIANATTKTYTPAAADVRKYLSLKVTATNTAGSASVWTASTWHVTQKATSIGGPILDEISQTGEQATVSAGEWAGEDAPTFTYDWFICPTRIWSSSSCRSFPGSSGSRTFTPITLGSSGVPKYLVSRVRGTNFPYLLSDFEVDRSANKKFDRDTFVASAEPLNEAPYWGLNTGPESVILPMPISDSQGIKKQANNVAANVGETLEFDFEATDWSAYPAIPSSNAFEYSWYGCTFERIGVFRSEQVPDDCELIAGQTGRQLVITEDLIGRRIMGKVKATNSTGVGYILTSITGPVAQKPFNISPPTISSGVEIVPTVGVQSSGQLGSWGGSPAPQADPARYQWYSCPTQVSDSSTLQSGCVVIQGATSSYFIPTANQKGQYLVFKVVFKNTINPQQTTAEKAHFSAGYGPVHMDPVFASADPQILGHAHVGSTLTVPDPNVTSYPVNANTDWDWYVCDTAFTNKAFTQAPDDCDKVSTGSRQGTLVVADEFADKFIAVFASSSNRPSVTAMKNSATTLKVTKQPTNTAAPSFTGTATVDGTNKFTPSSGTWSAFPAISARSYSWYLCTEAGIAAGPTLDSSCAPTPISGLTTASPVAITLKREWAGKSLVLAETAGQAFNNLPNSANRFVTHYSASSALLVSPPEFGNLPSFTGTLHVGEALTAAFTKNFAYDPDNTSYQWFSCSAQVTNRTSPTGCEAISGANYETFTLNSEDQVGRFVTVMVTLTNSVSTISSYALSGGQRVTMTPVNLNQVTVSGEALANASRTLAASAGTWRSNPTASLFYNWYVCDSPVNSATTTLPTGDCQIAQTSNGTPGTNKTLSVEAKHRGKYLLVAETATSTVNKPGAGTTTVYSASSSVIKMAPEFASNASFSGTLHVGQTLTGTVPSVQAYPLNSTQIEWWQCDSSVPLNAPTRPSGCSVIPNASTATLTLGAAQKGLFIAFALRNTNDSGFATKVFSNNSRVTTEPVNTVAPAISGSPNAATGTPIVVSEGTWDSFPVSTDSNFTYSWFSCPSSKAVSPTSISDCVEITTPSARSSSFIPTNDLAGRHLVARVTLRVATNLATASEASKFSASVGPVLTLPLFGSASPAVTGFAHVGSTLTGTHASTSGFEAPTSTSQWYQCETSVAAGLATPPAAASCMSIAGATGLTFTLTSAQEGKRILFMQTASNNQGSTTRVSATSAPVTSTPSNQTAATVSGSKTYSTNSTVSISRGVWAGTPAPVNSNFSYSWYVCPSQTPEAQVLNPGWNCVLIDPLTVTSDAMTIRVDRAWAGKYLVARETVTTTTNTQVASPGRYFTAGFGPFAPNNTAAPTLSKTTVATGGTIEARPGTWVFGETQNYSYRWFACTTAQVVADSIASSGCTLLSGATTSQITVPQGALGKYLVAEVSATNSGGTTTKTTKSTTGKVAAG